MTNFIKSKKKQNPLITKILSIQYFFSKNVVIFQRIFAKALLVLLEKEYNLCQTRLHELFLSVRNIIEISA